MHKMNLIGLGDAGCNIVELFKKYSFYTIYQIGSNVKKNKNSYYLLKQKKAEQYEDNIPKLKTFLRLVKNDVLFVVDGSGMSANASLVVLEQIKHCKISILYIKSDLELLNDIQKKQERVIYNVLQEYTRSGVFENIYIIDNSKLDLIIGQVKIKERYKAINDLIVWTIHTIFSLAQQVEPISTNFFDSRMIDRICTYSLIDFESGEEKSFFDLTNIKEKRYYYMLRKKEIEENINLMGKIKDQILEKKTLTENSCYSIFEVEYNNNIIICLKKSSEIQK